MLVDLLDKKLLDPPMLAEGSTTLKRKLDGTLEEVPAKKSDMEPDNSGPSMKAADLYAKLAVDILSDEDEEMDEPPATTIIKKIEAPPPQRQIIMNNNQLIMSPGNNTSTATIKTDSGIQTVPILLQGSNTSMQVGYIILLFPALCETDSIILN